MSCNSFYIFLNKQVEYKNINIGFALAAASILALSLLNPMGVGAQYYSQNELKKMVTVDKKIRLMKENLLLDNVPSSKYVFVDGDTIEFEITVTNTGNEDLTDIKLSDVLPKYLSLIFNPGSLDVDLDTLNWSLDKLLAGENKVYVVRAKISGFEASNGLQTIKLTNKALVTANGVSDQDSASYFVAKKIVPTTGDDSLPIKTALLVSVSVSALFLRKLARGY